MVSSQDGPTPLVPIFFNPIVCSYSDRREVDLALCHMYILTDYGHLPLIVSYGKQFSSSMICLNT